MQGVNKCIPDIIIQSQGRPRRVGFTVLKKGQTASRIIKLPLKTTKISAKASSNVCLGGKMSKLSTLVLSTSIHLCLR